MFQAEITKKQIHVQWGKKWPVISLCQGQQAQFSIVPNLRPGMYHVFRGTRYQGHNNEQGKQDPCFNKAFKSVRKVDDKQISSDFKYNSRRMNRLWTYLND